MIPIKFIPEIPESKLSPSVISKLNTIDGDGGASNPSITIATTLSAINNASANSIIEIQTAINGAGGSLTPPANATLYFTGGKITNIVSYVGNNTLHKIIGDNLAIDLTGCAVSGTFRGTEPLLATQFGAKDDNLITTDNKFVIRQILNIANTIPNSTLVINKKDTNEYWTLPGRLQEDLSPFYPNHDTTSWLIGVNGTPTKVVLEANLNVIPNNTKESAVFNIFDNAGSELVIKGNLRGDRYEHNYDQIITINGSATSSGDINLIINEQDPLIDNVFKNSINQSINLTVSSISNNKTQIINAINSLPAFADYTATSGVGNTISIVGQPGVYYRIKLLPNSTGAIFNTNANNYSDDHSSYEWGYGFVGGSNAKNFHVYGGGTIENFHGDAVCSDIQGNGTVPITSANMTTGRVNATTGVLDANETGFRTMTTSRNVPNQHLSFLLMAGSYSSNTLLHYRYWVNWYTAGDVFIEKSPQLKPYETYDRKPEFVKYKIEVDYAGATDQASFEYFFNSYSFGSGGIIENLTFKNNRRQSVSNPPQGVEFKNIYFDGVGGASPAWNIDYEDFKYLQIGGGVHNSVFKGGLGGIIIKGGQKLNFTGNRFIESSYDTDGHTDIRDFIGGIDSGYGMDNIFSNNTFDSRNNTIDRGTIFHNNIHNKGYMVYATGGGYSHHNTFKNVLVRDGQSTNLVTNSPAGRLIKSTPRSENDLFIINEPWSVVPLFDEYNSIKWVNRIIKFNDTESMYNLNLDNYPLIKMQSTVNNIVTANRTVPDATFKGSYINDEITGFVPQDSERPFVGFPYYCALNRGARLDCSVKFQAGFPKSFTVDDMKANGWGRFDLDQYATDGVGSFHNIRVINTTFHVPARVDATNGFLVNTAYGSTQWTRLLTIAQDKNVNFEFINCSFISDDLATTRYMYLGHRGTTLFKDCYFETAAPNSVDFTAKGAIGTSTNFRSSNNGVITMIGNRTNGNVSFTMDTGDITIDY